MATEAMIRTFLLGIADPEVERTIEEGILSGSLPAEDLVVIEEELIDDHVFGRLSPAEETAFHSSFFSNPERRGKVEFSRGMRKYATKNAAPRRWLIFRMSVMPRLALASSFVLLSVVTIAAILLGIRNMRLGRELAAISRTSDERQRLLASLTEQERQRAAEAEHAATTPSAVPRVPAASSMAVPGIELRPGVRRGVEAIPVVHFGGGSGAVRITLALAFKPEGGLRAELTRTGGERIWSQELPSPGPVTANGATTLFVPEQLLSPGDYQIRLKDLAGDASDEGDVYAFRVSR